MEGQETAAASFEAPASTETGTGVVEVTVEQILSDMRSGGLKRDAIGKKYNLSKGQLDGWFQHPLLKSQRTARAINPNIVLKNPDGSTFVLPARKSKAKAKASTEGTASSNGETAKAAKSESLAQESTTGAGTEQKW